MSKLALRTAYSQHFLRANTQGFIPLTFRAFVAVVAHSKVGAL
jgi:ureidoglycolate hydrolase